MPAHWVGNGEPPRGLRGLPCRYRDVAAVTFVIGGTQLQIMTRGARAQRDREEPLRNSEDAQAPEAELTPDQAALLAEQAEAEVAEAESAAMAARTRALRLREQAAAGRPPEAAEVDACKTASDGGASRADMVTRQPNGWRLPRLRLARPRLSIVAAVLALVCTAVLVAATGYFVWHQQKVLRQEHDRAEFTAAARQVVVTLMSIDFNNAQGDVQRIVNNSTGAFRDDFQHAAEDFIQVAKDAKVTTAATANAAAVESMTHDSAVVLVTASSTVTNAAGAKDAPRTWRLSVDLQREGDQIKMSKVEFVP